MKKFLLPVLTLMSLNSFAGNEKGNGGGVHFCPGKTQQEVYDVYEGKERYGLNISEQTENSREKILQDAIAKLVNVNPSFGHEVRAQLMYLKQEKNFKIKKELKLSLIPDANLLMVQEGCEYRQLANWDDVTGTVFVKKEYFEPMTNVNQVALYLHEAIYKVARLRKQEANSDKVRRIVAEILSTQEKISLEYFAKPSDVSTRDIARNLNFDIISVAEFTHKAELDLGDDSWFVDGQSIGSIKISIPEVKAAKEKIKKKEEELRVLESNGARVRILNNVRQELREMNSNAIFTMFFWQGAAQTKIGPEYESELSNEDYSVFLSCSSCELQPYTVEFEISLNDLSRSVLKRSFKVDPKNGTNRNVNHFKLRLFQNKIDL